MSQMAIDFDAVAAAAARDAAIKQATDHADEETPTWSSVALGAVRLFAMRHRDFLTEDIRQWAHGKDLGLALPPDSRAWGGVITRAKREGIIAPTDTFRPMQSVNCHRNPKRVWLSRMCA